MTGWTQIRLRRDGLPPLRFNGRLISRYDPAASPMAHALALYETIDGGYVAEIVARVDATPARCRAAAFDTLDGALKMMEDHDASSDIAPPVFADSISAAELAVQAASLRGHWHDVVSRYHTGVGAFLAALAVREEI